jgi:hypothetical protein
VFADDPTDDHVLMEARLQLGLPLQGFDGRDIPLRYASGKSVRPVEAALMLLESAAAAMSPEQARAYVADALDNAEAIEEAAFHAGASPFEIQARTTRSLVVAALEARSMATPNAEGRGIEHVVELWYQVNRWRGVEFRSAWRARPRSTTARS